MVTKIFSFSSYEFLFRVSSSTVAGLIIYLNLDFRVLVAVFLIENSLSGNLKFKNWYKLKSK